MSADNYILIRKWDVLAYPIGNFVVTNESASADKPSQLRSDHGAFFETLQDAWNYAKSCESEYGVEVDFPIKTTVEEVFHEQL